MMVCRAELTSGRAEMNASDEDGIWKRVMLE